jgi:aspartate aminotransferase
LSIVAHCSSCRYDGDEVIIPAPYFVSYPEVVKLLDRKPVLIECSATSGLRLTPQMLEAAITPATKWLFLNMPSNPSSVVYPRDELQALGEILTRHPHVLVLSDEIYEHIIFDDRRFVSWGDACSHLRERSLIVNGVSKAYAMTGWRGRLRGGTRPPHSCHGECSKSVLHFRLLDLASGRYRCARQATGGGGAISSSIRAQARSRGALNRDHRGFGARSSQGCLLCLHQLRRIDRIPRPNGTMLTDDAAIARYFLEEGKVAVVPDAKLKVLEAHRLAQ